MRDGEEEACCEGVLSCCGVVPCEGVLCCGFVKGCRAVVCVRLFVIFWCDVD